MKNVKNFLKQKKKNKAFRKDNRGSAIVLVIIAIAMIGILASTIMWAAYVNYMIKCADLKNKSSFYSSETVVEQIMAGMQHEASAAISVSYQEVMQNWSNDEDESSRFSRFTTSFLDSLVASLKDNIKGVGYYDRDVLESYVDTDLFTHVDPDEWDNPIYPSTMELINNSTLVLKNIRVSFTDENGYVSVVNTDICIDVPKLVFYQSRSIDNLYEYALIGNAGIETTGGSNIIDGSVYAGNGGIDDGGIVVNLASSLTVQNSNLVISKGDITVNGPTAGFIVKSTTGSDNKVYAAGLNVDSATLSLDSKTYVANDLILSGTGSKATLTKEYYGFGSSKNTGIGYDPNDASTESYKVMADNSSAILINGKNATVDMSGITKLFLAGRAYIGQQRTAGSTIEEANKVPPILMGESIAVKGDQIAYLVPAECIGVRNTDGEKKTVIGQNPMNVESYTKMQAYIEEYGNGSIKIAGGGGSLLIDPTAPYYAVDFYKPVYKLGNKSLSDFGVDDMSRIREVHAQYNSSDDNNKQLVYYYLVLDKEMAAKYFVQYYDFNANKEALDNYFNKYATGGIILGDYDAENTQYTILGNSIVSGAVSGSSTLFTGVAQSLEESEGYQESSENAEEVNNILSESDAEEKAADISVVYESLCTNLTETASVGGNQNVFNSIIREDMLRQYYIDHPELGGVLEFTTDDGYKAVLTNRDNYEPSDNKIRLIIAIDKDYNPHDADSKVDGGNVTIDKNFTGMIIAQGKVTISGNVTISRDKTNVYRVINTPLSNTDPQIAMDFFVNGSGMLTNEVTDTSKVDASGTLDLNLSQIVRYSNWIKK